MDLRPGYPAVVDEVTVRLVAAAVLLMGLAALVSGAWWVYAVLALDFLLRAVFGPRLSPLAQAVLRWVRPLLDAGPRPTAGPPKRFAASIGAGCTIVAAVAGALVAAAPASFLAPLAGTLVLVLGVVMVLFPALEAFAGLCVGCVIFARLIAWGVVPPASCVECADISRRTGAQPA